MNMWQFMSESPFLSFFLIMGILEFIVKIVTILKG